MKSMLNNLTITLLVIVLGLSFTACSNDDEPRIETPKVESQWNSPDLSMQFQSGNKLAGWNNKGTFSGTYSINATDNTYSYDVTFATGVRESAVNKKYIITNNTLTLDFCGQEYSLDKCNDSNNSILGKWELVNRSMYPSFYTINILSNGNFEVVYEPGESVEAGGFEWEISGSKLILYFDTEFGHDDYLIGEYVVIGNEMRYTNDYSSDSDKLTSTFIMKRL